MRLPSPPQLQYDIPLTTEMSVLTSGAVTFDTRNVRTFQYFLSNQLLDPRDGFTRREMAEISSSLVDISRGDFKVIRTREELFADLDQ
jgi:hypothetical protein